MKKEADTLILENGSAIAGMPFSMVRIWSFALLLTSFLWLSCKPIPQVQTIQNTKTEFVYFNADNLGNIYSLNSENEINKTAIDKQFNYLYDNTELGTINYIDVSNPLSILVGHPEFQTINVLDVTLRETAKIYLPDSEVVSDSLAFCRSNDGNIWVYDDFETRIVKLGEASEIIEFGERLIEYTGIIPRVSSMVQGKRYILLNAPLDGIIVLDQFGKYMKTLPFKGLDRIFLINNNLLYQRDGALNFHNLDHLEKGVVAKADSVQFLPTGDRLFTWDKLGIQEYVFSEN